VQRARAQLERLERQVLLALLQVLLALLALQAQVQLEQQVTPVRLVLKELQSMLLELLLTLDHSQQQAQLTMHTS
jgi:hypothetical protein